MPHGKPCGKKVGRVGKAKSEKRVGGNDLRSLSHGALRSSPTTIPLSTPTSYEGYFLFVLLYIVKFEKASCTCNPTNAIDSVSA